MEAPFFRFSLFSNFPNLIHGISNRNYGDMRFGNLNNSEIIKNREQFYRDLGIVARDVVTSNQVHGNNIVIIGSDDRGRGSIDPNSEIPETDGLITSEKNIFLMIKTADCLPIIIYDPILEIVAILHAGWRGVMDKIVNDAITKLVKIGSDPENIIVGIGPGICQKHFIVRNNVLKKFLTDYPSATFVRNKDGYVDLKKAVLSDLKKRKIPQSNIEISDICTVCDNGIYGSFRKEGEDVPEFASIIGMKK